MSPSLLGYMKLLQTHDFALEPKSVFLEGFSVVYLFGSMEAQTDEVIIKIEK